MTDENNAIAVSTNTDEGSLNANLNDSNNRINCWVCFGSPEDDKDAEWVQPCKCRGFSKWVHQSCLQRWIDEKQKGNSSAAVSCPACNEEYILVFPPFGKLFAWRYPFLFEMGRFLGKMMSYFFLQNGIGRLVFILDVADRIMFKVCPLATAGIVVGSIYWTAVTYGAVTVMQILGHKEGLNTMEQADPLVLLVGLPTIPIMLILGRMVRWEDYVLRLWRKYWNRIPGLKKLLGGTPEGFPERPPPDVASFNDPVSATRVLCGALLLPTMATMFGRVLFSHIPNNPHRTLLGGMTFIAVKGVLKMYLRQQQYVRQCQRKILNYDKNATFPHSPAHSQISNCSDNLNSDSSSNSDYE